ncbi:MAG: SGNH/GDSL hydrolase family protein [Pyrinomonadaceae bacterium]
MLRVACLGASTTEGMQGDEETYPYFLQQELSQLFPGREIEVINAGHHGQDIDDLLEILRQRVLPLEPDIILFYEAANNINWPEFIEGLSAPCFGDCWLRQYPDWYGSLYRRSALFDLITESFGLNDRMPPPMPHDLDNSFIEASAKHYREVLSEITREASSRGSAIVLTSFVTLAHEGLTVSVTDQPLIYREVYRRLYPLTPGEVARVYAIFNQQSAAAAREFNVPYADVAPQFPRDAQYFDLDYIHLSPEGDRLLAKLFANFLARAVIHTLKSGQSDNPAPPAKLRGAPNNSFDSSRAIALPLCSVEWARAADAGCSAASMSEVTPKNL